MYLNSWNMYIKVLNLQEYELPFSLRFQERFFLKEKNLLHYKTKGQELIQSWKIKKQKRGKQRE